MSSQKVLRQDLDAYYHVLQDSLPANVRRNTNLSNDAKDALKAIALVANEMLANEHDRALLAQARRQG